MARKIKFALEMADGAKVRGSLEELREHFDLESAVRYFLSGKLVEWLDDRYYEKEAEALEAIEKDAPNLNKRLCEALGLEYDAEEDLDVAALERLNEKKSVLRQRTDDEEIIKNADKTALTQEDLADLLDMGEDVIYLCGEEFTVPARVKNKKYIGILGTPKVSINAMSQEELEAKGIVFENVVLPWGKSNKTNTTELKENVQEKIAEPKLEKIKELFWIAFPQHKEVSFPIWEVVTNSGKKVKMELNEEQKEIALRLVCNGLYDENAILYIKVKRDFSAGLAFTYDSFCYGGVNEKKCIWYKDIYLAEVCHTGFHLIDANGGQFGIVRYCSSSGYGLVCEEALVDTDGKAKRIASFLSTVTHLYPSKPKPAPAPIWA